MVSANERNYAYRPTPFHEKLQQRFAFIKEAIEMFPIENMIDTDEWYKKVSTEYIKINDFNK